MPRTKAPTGPASLVLTATVARRYYFDGDSKSEIADDLELSRFKVARLLDQARETGLVRIELDYRGEIDLDLSAQLRSACGLRHCVVIDSPEDDTLLLRGNVGRAAAELLSEIVTADDVLGVAWGRALMAMRSALTSLPACPVVQLTGALARSDADDSSLELVRDVARVSSGTPFFFYAPMFVGDAATAEALRAQPEVARAVNRFPDLTKAVVGLGAWEEGQSTVADALTEEERRDHHRLGVRAETCGLQLDADGNAVTTSLTDRLIGIDAAQLRAVDDVIAIVYGAAKAGAVRAAVRGGYVDSLVTHTGLARAVLASR
jgi:DNA-binding transcriptional regulator LsrR (DeoR family)